MASGDIATKAASTLSSRDLNALRSEIAEDQDRFLSNEQEELARRWRWLAPGILLLVIVGETIPFFSPEFPSTPRLAAATLILTTAILSAAWRGASHRTLSRGTVALAVLGSVYAGVTTADAGGFESLHVLGIVLVIAILPGAFPIKLRHSTALVGGSVLAFIVSCALALSSRGASLEGVVSISFYTGFLGVFTVFTVERGRRLRYRDFVSRQVAERLHRFAVEEVLYRHLPPLYVKRVLSGEQSLNAAPERRVITVMFADIVAFTPLSERLAPEHLAELMARFYQLTGAAAFRRGATIDKFIGDAVMAILGAPDAMSPAEQATNAVQLAKDWHEVAATLRTTQEDPVGLGLRIGIHQDVVAVGVFGGEPRSDYTVLGRGVNIAARLEQRCRPGEIVLSQTVLESLGDASGAIDLGLLELKGIPNGVHCYAIPIRPTRAALTG